MKKIIVLVIPFLFLLGCVDNRENYSDLVVNSMPLEVVTIYFDNDTFPITSCDLTIIYPDTLVVTKVTSDFEQLTTNIGTLKTQATMYTSSDGIISPIVATIHYTGTGEITVLKCTLVSGTKEILYDIVYKEV